MTPVPSSTAERVFRKTAQLRVLTESLRRAKERATREPLRAEFESYCRTIESNTGAIGPMPSPGALLEGIKDCWVRGDYGRIIRLGSILPRELLAQQSLLRAYITAAASR